MIEIHTDNGIPQIMSSGSVGWISERHITHGGCYGNFPGHRTNILIARPKTIGIGTCHCMVRIHSRCFLHSWECPKIEKRDLCVVLSESFDSRKSAVRPKYRVWSLLKALMPHNWFYYKRPILDSDHLPVFFFPKHSPFGLHTKMDPFVGRE